MSVNYYCVDNVTTTIKCKGGLGPNNPGVAVVKRVTERSVNAVITDVISATQAFHCVDIFLYSASDRAFSTLR